jgi:hypothetical protein
LANGAGIFGTIESRSRYLPLRETLSCAAASVHGLASLHVILIRMKGVEGQADAGFPIVQRSR